MSKVKGISLSLLKSPSLYCSPVNVASERKTPIMKVMGIRNPYEQAMKPTASAGKYDAKASNVKGASFIDSHHKPLSERKLNPSSLSPTQIFEKENYR